MTYKRILRRTWCYVSFLSLMACVEHVPEIVADVDGNSYKTVRIGEQTWMAEDMRAQHYADGTALKVVQNNAEWRQLSVTDAALSFNDKIPGTAYYTFAAASRGDDSGIDVQGICPDGWHLPSNDDWRELISFLSNNGYNFDETIGGGPQKVAKALASQSGWAASDRLGHIGFETEKNNRSGFTAKPIAYRELTGLFYPYGTYAYWWSSTVDNDGAAYARLMGFIFAQIGLNPYDKSYGFAVRCVQNKE